jgi:hypothetical protein
VLKLGYELEFEDNFDAEQLSEERWIDHYLPHWTSWVRTAARYAIDRGQLQLLIEEDQLP